MSIKNSILSLFGLLFLPFLALATHNRAGEIVIKQTGPLTIEATVITYTKASSVAADRDSVTIVWGDGTKTIVARKNGTRGNNGVPQGEILPNDTKKNLYTAVHTFPSLGRWTISMTDPNRNGGIENVNYPQSDNVQFHVQTVFTLFSSQTNGTNNTPNLLQPPIDFGCVGQVFTHNPNAYDTDGDSLAYFPTIPLQAPGVRVPNFVPLDKISPGVNNQVTLNPVTGTLTWAAPQKSGEYNYAMLIVEYRNGVPIDTMIRDMQILILRDCDNKPPVVKVPEQICVIAGSVVNFSAIATDPDSGSPKFQQVQLTALGGPFEKDRGTPATLAITPTAGGAFKTPPVTGTFRWQTQCEDISDQFYTVVFKAQDNFRAVINGQNEGLADLKTVKIKVVGPPPLDVQSQSSLGQIEVSWKSPYHCDQAKNNFFYGFSIYRKENSNQFPLDTCKNGLAGRGYTLIAFGKKDININGRYNYIDKSVERGKTYCYRIVGVFARRTSGGNPYNLVESLPSEEVCVQLGRDVPLTIRASVITTHAATGEIEVRWTKPRAKDLDTLQNPGPYRYQVLRATGQTQTGLTEIAGASFTSNSFSSANDTVFVDKNLNTVANPYTYRIAFYVRGETQPLGYTSFTSSIFLRIAPTDQANVLSWTELVPWNNYRYDIFRLNPNTNKFDSIGTTIQKTYTDAQLVNGKEYCYYVRAIGTYGVKDVVSPLINLSQQACATPKDNIPPCPPVLVVSDICKDANINQSVELLENKLSWTNPNNVCKGKKDVVKYNLYYAESSKIAFKLFKTIENIKDTTAIHKPLQGIAGCYAVTAVDSVGNESAKSNVVCIDNCPLFELPNTFTPNSDGQNDVFKATRNRFIASIELQVFNRWGNLVYESKDAKFEWNGKDTAGNDLAEGTYYYVCKYYEQRVEGTLLSTDIKSGFIELIRGE